jgi:hypothetical protein
MKRVHFGATEVSTYHQEEPKQNYQDALPVNKRRSRAVFHEVEADLSSTDKSSNPSKSLRKYHQESILTLQQEHEEHGILDEKGLQSLSRVLSQVSAKQAQERAKEAAFAAFKIHAESTTCYLLTARTAEEYARKTGRRISITKNGNGSSSSLFFGESSLSDINVVCRAA